MEANKCPNHSLEYYEVRQVYGKQVLSTLDGNTTFPYETKEEKKQTESLFKKETN